MTADPVKRWRVTYRFGVVEDRGGAYPADASKPMVLASDYDALAATVAGLNRKLDEAEATRSSEAFAGALADELAKDTIAKLTRERDEAMARLRVAEAALSDIDTSANGPTAVFGHKKYNPWSIANYCIERAGEALEIIGPLPTLPTLPGE